jgi:hypothetical protein
MLSVFALASRAALDERPEVVRGSIGETGARASGVLYSVKYCPMPAVAADTESYARR